MTLTTAQLDRAVGILLGAAGDALGTPYEFGPPLGPELEVPMPPGPAPSLSLVRSGSLGAPLGCTEGGVHDTSSLPGVDWAVQSAAGSPMS